MSSTQMEISENPVGKNWRWIALGTVIVLIAVIVTAVVVRNAKSSPEAPTLIHTTAGDLEGFVADGARQFQGVPYGAAPIGDLRWKAPEPAPAWQGVRQAKEPTESCVQQAAAFRPAPASVNEDCLSLNIYTPANMSSDDRLPITLFFHGGGTFGGSTDQDPTRYASMGSIAITVNYRIGVMGFLTLPGLDDENPESTSGNYGLLDQILALQWVQDNASAFGGDADRVTIAGQSFGGGMVCGLLTSPKAAGLFDAAIIESANNACAMKTQDEYQAAAVDYLALVGCDLPDSAQTVECLREAPIEKLLDAQPEAGTWRPAVDGVVIPQSPPDAFASGDFNKVPVLNGTNSMERTVSLYENHDLAARPVLDSEYESAMTEEFAELAPDVMAQYPLDSYPSASAAIAAAKTDKETACTALARNASLAQYTDVYSYEFRDTTAPLRSYQLPKPSLELGAQHYIEVPYIWGAPDAILTPLTQKQQDLGDQMIQYWHQFAAEKNMSPQGLPSLTKWTAEDTSLVAFETNGAEIADDLADNHNCAFWFATYQGNP